MRHLHIALVTLAAAAGAWVVGCGSDDDPGNTNPALTPDAASETSLPEAGPEGSLPESAAEAQADAEVKPDPAAVLAQCKLNWQSACETWQTCLPYYFTYYFESVDQCVQDQAKGCAEMTLAAGSNETLEDLKACGDKYPTTNCSELIHRLADNPIDPECDVVPGDRANGEPCYFHSQCQSKFCTGTKTGCGVCATAPKLDEDCDVTGACEKGLLCPAGGKCAKLAKVGEACSAQFGPCEAALFCNSEGKCELRDAAGEDCDPYASAGTCEFNFLCNLKTKKCEVIATTAKPGEPCGYTAEGGFAACEHGAVCKFTNKTTWTGVCEAFGSECFTPTDVFGETSCDHTDVCDQDTCKPLDYQGCI